MNPKNFSLMAGAAATVGLSKWTDNSEYETFQRQSAARRPTILANRLGQSKLGVTSPNRQLGVWVEGSAVQEVASIVDGMVLASRRITKVAVIFGRPGPSQCNLG